MSALPRARAPAMPAEASRAGGWTGARTRHPASRAGRTPSGGHVEEGLDAPARHEARRLVGVLGHEVLGGGLRLVGVLLAQDDDARMRRVAAPARHGDAPLVVPALDEAEVALAVRRAPLDDVLDVLVEQDVQLLGHGLNLLGMRRLRSPPSCAGPAAR